eukprot:GILI01010113.1.p1 GENE.GILI01010113.1~~GILI01010113.1.p1  ORF type:complete len:488 (-),score=181.90 GILI01010113.1:18-1481(-)
MSQPDSYSLVEEGVDEQLVAPPKWRKTIAGLAVGLVSLAFLGIMMVVFSGPSPASSLGSFNLENVAVHQSVPSEEILRSLFDQFIEQYDKQYASADEKDMRFSIFKENVHYSRSRNLGSSPLDYTVGVNKFADMTHAEFRHTLTPLEQEEEQMTLGAAANGATREKFVPDFDQSIPSSVDWREANGVTTVIQQDRCGSCWTFASAGAIEGIRAVKTGELIMLSKQELVDCATEGDGCKGGLPSIAFKYVGEQGIASEKSYPYTSIGPEWDSETGKTRGECKRSSAARVSGKLTKFMDVEKGCEKCLTYAIARQPLAVAVNADCRDFQLYKTGVFNDPDCNPDGLNHAVMAVGYGTEDSKPYYLVKNSWGPGWGDKGFIKVKRTSAVKDSKGMAGIASMASFPVIEASIELRTCGGKDSGSACALNTNTGAGCDSGVTCAKVDSGSGLYKKVTECVNKAHSGCAKLGDKGIDLTPSYSCRKAFVKCHA